MIDFTGASTSYTMVGSARVSVSSMDYLNYPVIGKLGDHIKVDGNEPSPLGNQDVQDDYITLDFNPAEGPVLVCGSPNEVASDPYYGDHGFDVVTPEGTGYRSFSIWEFAAQRHTTWTHFALSAVDQLRQKTAWSLSQIVAVGLPGSGMVFNEETEHHLAFYDIFLNNAFGNYLGLMKEVTFSVIMGGWLSFIGNKSLQYNMNEGLEKYPDENVRNGRLMCLWLL